MIQKTALSKSCMWSWWLLTVKTFHSQRWGPCNVYAVLNMPSWAFQKALCHSWNTWTVPSSRCLTRHIPSAWQWRSHPAAPTRTSGAIGEYPRTGWGSYVQLKLPDDVKQISHWMLHNEWKKVLENLAILEDNSCICKSKVTPDHRIALKHCGSLYTKLVWKG